MATSGLVAVDVVLRECEAVAALPSIVRAIRRFADAPVLAKLKRAMVALASAAELDELLARHNDDVRLEALESGGCMERVREPALQLSRAQLTLVNDIFVFGAKRGSMCVVEWAITSARDIHVNGALRAAVNYGQLAVVQLLHPKVKRFGLGFTEDSLLNLAAARGHLDILRWMYASRRDAGASCTWLASENAAKGGHLEVLQWILATVPDQWSDLVLEKAALHGQQQVMDWLFEKRLGTRVASAMESLAQKDAVDGLLWLHDKYPEHHLFLSTLKKMASGAQLDLVTRVVTAFPKSYTAYGVAIGVICGDLALVKKLAAGRRRLKRREVKSAMCLAASCGFLDILEWLGAIFASFLPTKALWRAVRCGHMNVICWIAAQKPELLTPGRLAEMHATSTKQPKSSSSDRKGDMQQVTRWIETQQQQQ